MLTQDLFSRTRLFVQQHLAADASGHDWFHVERVWRMARYLAGRVGARVLIVELAALLHDISDYKLNGGDEGRGPSIARDWLSSNGVPRKVVEDVTTIIRDISFRGALVESPRLSLEGQVVQDADRLDAIGAIGIARAFAFGGFVHQQLFDPAKPPRLHASFDDYKDKRSGTAVNHFYEKLLLLSERLNTAPARSIAAKRHRFMEEFLREFLDDCAFGDTQRDQVGDGRIEGNCREGGVSPMHQPSLSRS